MSDPDGQHAAESHRFRNFVLAASGTLVALYFLAPVVFMGPLVVAYYDQLIPPHAFQAVYVAFAPIERIARQSPGYGKLTDAQWRLFFRCFPKYGPRK